MHTRTKEEHNKLVVGDLSKDGAGDEKRRCCCKTVINLECQKVSDLGEGCHYDMYNDHL